MATTRKRAREKTSTTPRPPRVGVREFTVVLEDVRSQFKVFGEGLQGLDEKVTRLDEKVTRIDERVTRLDENVTRIDERVTRLDENVTRIDERVARVDENVTRIDREMSAGFERVDRELGLVKAVVLDHSRELREIRSAVKRVEDAVEKKVDRDEVEPIVERVVARARTR